MKKFILVLVLLISFIGFSQEKIEMTKDGIVNAEQIIKLDSLTAKEIYSRINKYIQKNYANPDLVSKGNIENEFISFNGIKKDCITRKIMLTNFYYSLEYFFNIEIKDGKIKLMLTKAQERNYSENVSYMNPINCFFPSTYNLFNNKGEPRTATSSLVIGFNNNINEVVNDLISSIKNSKKSDW